MTELQIGKAIVELTIGDITTQTTDAVVNAANTQLAPGGGVAGAIHRAAGPQLWEECKTLGGCQTGEAKLTKGYHLPVPYIIHTVGPVYSGSPDDPKQLASCYKNSLQLARKHNLNSISFPALSTGYFGYPLKDAATIALTTVIHDLEQHPDIELVRFVLYDKATKELFEEILQDKKDH